MKIEFSKGVTDSGKLCLGDIAVGVTFLASKLNEDTKKTEVFLRTYSGVVSLTHPNRTWSAADNCSVLGYQPVSVRAIVTLLDVDIK